MPSYSIVSEKTPVFLPESAALPSLHLLQNKGIRISDGKLRSMLSQLEQDGLIHVGKGRCGTLITEKEFALLKDSSKI